MRRGKLEGFGQEALLELARNIINVAFLREQQRQSFAYPLLV